MIIFYLRNSFWWFGRWIRKNMIWWQMTSEETIANV
jgi:hypothetical protein